MFCMKCGKELPEDARFCLNCGAELPEQKENPEQAQPEAVPAEQPQPDAREAEQSPKPAPRKKPVIAIVAAVVALVLCAAVALGIVMKPAKGPFGELYDLSPYSDEVRFQYVAGGRAVCYMKSDYDNQQVPAIRRVIREAELQEVKGKKAEELIQRVSSSERIKITLCSSSLVRFELTVSCDGEIIVYGKDKEFGEGVCYQGGQEIFDTVKVYIPAGTGIHLADIFPEGDTGYLSVWYRDANGSSDGAALSDEEIVAACIEAIRPKSLKLTSSDNMSYDGEVMSLSFSTSGAGIVEFWTDGSGDGKLEMDGWIYYLSDVDSLVGPMERAIKELS